MITLCTHIMLTLIVERLSVYLKIGCYAFGRKSYPTNLTMREQYLEKRRNNYQELHTTRPAPAERYPCNSDSITLSKEYAASMVFLSSWQAIFRKRCLASWLTRWLMNCIERNILISVIITNVGKWLYTSQKQTNKNINKCKLYICETTE